MNLLIVLVKLVCETLNNLCLAGSKFTAMRNGCFEQMPSSDMDRSKEEGEGLSKGLE